MTIILTILVSILHFFNCFKAIYGEWNFINHPDGSALKMLPEYLKHSRFPDYLTPGIILFIANGLFSLLVMTTILYHIKNYAWFIIAQGVIVTGWIVIQLIIVQAVRNLHLSMELWTASNHLRFLLKTKFNNNKNEYQ